MWLLVVLWGIGAVGFAAWEAVAFASGVRCWDCFKNAIVKELPPLGERPTAFWISLALTCLITWPFITYDRIMNAPTNKHRGGHK